MDAGIVSGVLVMIVAAAALVVASRSPFHAFCVFLTMLPFENALAYKGPFTITPAYVFLAVTLVVMLFPRHRGTAMGSLYAPGTIWVLVFLGVAVASLGMAIAAPPPIMRSTSELLRLRTSEYRPIAQIVLLLYSATAYFVTLYCCSTAKRLKFATRLMVVIVGMTALYGLFQAVGARAGTPLIGPYASSLRETPVSLRPNATFQEAMNFGHFLLVGLPLLIVLYLHRTSLSKHDRFSYGIASVPLIIAMAMALLLTIGRAAWLGFALSFVVIVLLSDRSARKQVGVLAGVAVVAAFAVAIATFGSIDVAFATVQNRFAMDAGSLLGEQRLWYFPFLIDLFREYPILGVGYGNYPIYQVFAFDLYGIAGAYGVFWQTLVETGLAGFVALLLMMGSLMLALVRSIRLRNSWRPYLVGWLSSLIGLMTGYLFFSDRINVYMWVALGLAASTAKAALQPEEAE
jgi:O-antigen ligase